MIRKGRINKIRDIAALLTIAELGPYYDADQKEWNRLLRRHIKGVTKIIEMYEAENLDV